MSSELNTAFLPLKTFYSGHLSNPAVMKLSINTLTGGIKIIVGEIETVDICSLMYEKISLMFVRR